MTQMEEESGAAYLDRWVVPVGVIVYLIYNLFLLYRRLTLQAESTYFDFMVQQRRRHLQRILQGEEEEERVTFMADMSSNMTLANTYASYSLTLISIIGGLLTASSSLKPIVYGDSSAVTGATKHVSIFIFALAAFLCFESGGRSFADAKFLISMPQSAARPEYVEEAVILGFVLCEVGYRSFYFSLALVVWFLGPILMLAACLMLVAVLYIRDSHTIPLASEDSMPGREGSVPGP